MADNINVGVTIRAQGGEQVTAEMNRVRASVTDTGNAAQATSRQFAALAQQTTSANAIYNDHINRLSMTAREYQATRLAAQGLTTAQIQNIQTLEDSQATAESTAKMYTMLKVAAIAAGTALFAMAKSGIDALDNLNDLSLKTGIAADKLSGLQLVAKQSGTDLDSLAFAINRLNIKMANNSEAFRKIGIDSKDPLEAFIQLTAVLENIQDPQTRAALGAEALDRSWLELAPTLANGSAAMMQTIADGMELSDVTVQMTKDADQFNDQVAIMTSWLGSLSMKLVGPVLDGFNQLSAHIRAATRDAITFTNVMRGIGNFAMGKDITPASNSRTPKIDYKITQAQEELRKAQSGPIDRLRLAVGDDSKKLESTAKLNTLLREREQILKSMDSNQKQSNETQKVTAAAIQNFITPIKQATAATGGHTEAIKRHGGAVGQHTVSVNSAQRAQEATNRAINQAIASLKDQHAKLTLSERDYFAQSDAISKMSAAKKAEAMAIWDSNKAQEATSKSNEAQKSEMDALIDKYKQLTLSAREYYQQVTLPKTGLTTPGQQAPYLAQFDKTETATADAGKISKSKAALDSYNSSLDSANTKTADLSELTTSLGDVTSSVFDGALGGVNLLVGAFGNMVTAIDATTAKLAENNAMQAVNNALANSPEKIANTKKYAKEEIKLNNDLLKSKITGVRQIAAATSAMLKQGSTEQKVAHTIEMAMFGAELAMNILRIAGIEAVTIAHLFGSQQKIAQNTVEAGSNAVVAISSQAGAGPYIGFVLMAAMAAAMAAIGAMSGGSSAAVAAPNPYQSPTTGTVLGDASAQSESINKTYELLQDIHAEEYAELRSINEGVWKLSSGITNVITKALQTGYLTGTTYGPHLGESKYKVAGGGMAIAAISFGELLSGVFELQGQMFLTESKLLSKKGKPAKYKYTDYFSEMTDETTKALTDVFMAIAQTMSGVGKELGKIIGFDFSEQLKNYIIPALKIDLRELTGKEAVEKVNGVISTAMDQMATAVFGDIVGQYQQLGEGMLETAIRVVAQFVVVKDALNQAGLSMADDALALSDALVTAAGGLKEFQTQFENYYDKFYTDQEKTERLYQRLVSQLSDVNLILPKTREEYRKLFDALDLNNELDVERYTLLLKLATAADTYYTAIKDATEATKEAAKAQKEYYESLGESANAAVNAANTAYNNAMKEVIDTVKKALEELMSVYEAQIKQVEATIAKLTDFIAKMKQFKDSLVLSNLSTATPAKKYAESRTQLMDAYKIIQAGPGKTDASKAAYELALKDIEEKAKTFLENSRVYNASGSQYTKDYQLIMDMIGKTTASAKVQITEAQKQLAALNKTYNILVEINKSILSAKNLKEISAIISKDLKGLISSITGQMTASLKAAMDKLNAAIKAQQLASKAESLKYIAAVKAQAEMSKAIASNRKAGTDLTAAKTTVTDKQAAVKAAQITYEAAKTKDKQQAAAILKWQEDANRAVAENKFYYERAKASGDTETMQRLIDQLPSLQKNAVAANATAAKLTASSETLKAKADLEAKQKDLEKAQVSLATAQKYYDATVKLIDYLESVRVLTALKDELTQYTINALGRQLTAAEIAWIVQLTKKPSVYDAYASIDTYALTHGTHAKGLDFVPFDGYRAELHKGERILTASQANDNGVISQEIIAELKMLRKEVEQLRSEQKNQTGALIQSNYDANDRGADKIVSGSKDASKDLVWAAKNKVVII